MKSYCFWRHIAASGVSSLFGHPECIIFFFPNFLFIWLSNFILFLSLEIFVYFKYLFCRPPLELSRPRRSFQSPPSPLLRPWSQHPNLIIIYLFFCIVVLVCLLICICFQHFEHCVIFCYMFRPSSVGTTVT